MLCWATWTLEFFSRTIDISPVRVKALANPGPSDKGSGLPRGPQPRRSPAVPCLSPGRPQLLTSPSRWTRWSRSSCASRGPRECTRLPAPNATGTASVRPTLRPLPCPQDASAARPLPRPHLHGPLSVPHRQTRLPARLLSAVSLQPRGGAHFPFETLLLNRSSFPGEAKSLQGTGSASGADSVLPASGWPSAAPPPSDTCPWTRVSSQQERVSPLPSLPLAAQPWPAEGWQ